MELKESKQKMMLIRLEEQLLFENYPFQVKDDEAMLEMVESIKRHASKRRMAHVWHWLCKQPIMPILL